MEVYEFVIAELQVLMFCPQALYELVKCDFDPEEALRRLKFNVKAARGGPVHCHAYVFLSV